jgi:hypothetical protein
MYPGKFGKPEHSIELLHNNSRAWECQGVVIMDELMFVDYGQHGMILFADRAEIG